MTVHRPGFATPAIWRQAKPNAHPGDALARFDRFAAELWRDFGVAVLRIDDLTNETDRLIVEAAARRRYGERGPA